MPARGVVARGQGWLTSRLLSLPRPTTGVAVERDLPIPMPDGVVLLADRYHPDPAAGGPAPIILMRLPYGRRGAFGLLFRAMAGAGYQVVVVSVRGTFGSGGDFDPFFQEKSDGAAVLGWLERQPWFVPNVGLAGASYFGMTQWAVAQDAPDWVKSMHLGATSSWFRDLIYPGDVLALETLLSWCASIEVQERGWLSVIRAERALPSVLAPALRTLPLQEADTAAVGHELPYWQEWLQHEARDDDYWSTIDFRDAATVAPPASLVGGWYDLFLPYQLQDFARLRAAGRTARLLVGPWTHSSPRAMKALVQDSLDWAAVNLRGHVSDRRSDVRVFVMGSEQWRDLDAWPPASTPTRYHLHAGLRLGAGASEPSAPDSYRYDPADPTPSIGGAGLKAKTSGPQDNRVREERADVLSYTSDVLEQDVTVIGEVGGEIWFASSLEHTDLVLRLCDVDPTGTSTNVTDGIVRLPSPAAEPQPDGTVKVIVPCFPTAMTFRRGHRIRLQVSSGMHPFWARNPGSGEPVGTAVTLRVADQLVHHDPEHPSAIVLPVVPAT